MSERIVNGYKRLFEVRVLHHYWLDDGSTLFDTLPESRRNKLLLHYDLRSFMEITPTASTAKLLDALRGIFKNTSQGCVVAVPKAATIPDDAVFLFVLTISDPAFFRYTALTFINRRIFEFYYQAQDKIERYKENVPVFSNLTGVSRGANPKRSLFLSKEIPAPAATDKAEFLNINAGALVQLTSSQPGAATQLIHASAANVPVFSHQNDSPDIIPLPGLTGVPERGILFNSEIPDNVFGMINIATLNPVDSDFSCTSGGFAKEAYPVFQVRFKNRSAYWKYLNKNTGGAVSESNSPLPLTSTGNAGTKRKPGNADIKVQFESNDPSKRIEKIYTEIFE